MKRYSVFAIAREAARYHAGWERAWASPEPKAEGGRPAAMDRRPRSAAQRTPATL